MSYTLFISDLHLDPARPEHLDALKKLLAEHAGKADALYVLEIGRASCRERV